MFFTSLIDTWGDPNKWGMLTANNNDAAQKTASTLNKLGLFTSIIGGMNSAIGTYYSAKTAQYQLESQALDYKFQSDMAALNSRSMEYDAQSILEAGKSDVARYTMEAGQRKSAAKTAMASRGVALGEGSTRDVEASMDIVKDIDVLTINSNAAREAESRRMAGQSYRNQATMLGVSAQNARLSRKSISPKFGMFNSLLGSATSIASQWDWQRRIDKMVYGGRS